MRAPRPLTATQESALVLLEQHGGRAHYVAFRDFAGGDALISTHTLKTLEKRRLITHIDGEDGSYWRFAS